MGRVPYWRLFYHLVWATRGRAPLIDDKVGRLIARSIRATSRELDATVHAIGGTPDHVHVAVSVPPKIAVSTYVGRIKGASAHAVNDDDGTPRQVAFAWQAEYGVLSFGEKALPDVVAYINDQPTRHATKQLWPSLEHATDRREPASAGLSG